MDTTTKAYLKIGLGYFKGANALAGAFGYGAVTFLTGNHRHSHHALQMMRVGLVNAKYTISEGKAELAKANGK